MSIRLLNAATATNGVPSNTAATGSITAAAGSAQIEDSFFILNDGINPHVKFIMDSDASVTETAFVRKIAYTVGDSAATVHTAIINAINSATPTLAITASDGGGAVVTLTHDLGGTHGNRTLSQTSNTTANTVSAMSGGAFAGFSLAGEQIGYPGGYWLKRWDAGVISGRSVAGSATMTYQGRVWVMDQPSKLWHPAGIGTSAAPVADRGKLNDGNTIAEDGADIITFTQPIQGLSAYERIYLETTTIGGTNTAITAFLHPRAV